MHPRAPSRSPTVTSRASPATHQKSRHWHPSSLRSPGRGDPRCSERYSTERRTSEPVSLKSSRCLGVPFAHAIGTLSCRALLPFTLVRQRAVVASCFVDAPSVRSAVVGRRPQGVGRSYFPDIVLASGSHSSGAVQTRTRLFSGQRLGGVPCLWICERMLDG